MGLGCVGSAGGDVDVAARPRTRKALVSGLTRARLACCCCCCRAARPAQRQRTTCLCGAPRFLAPTRRPGKVGERARTRPRRVLSGAQERPGRCRRSPPALSVLMPLQGGPDGHVPETCNAIWKRCSSWNAGCCRYLLSRRTRPKGRGEAIACLLQRAPPPGGISKLPQPPRLTAPTRPYPHAPLAPPPPTRHGLRQPPSGSVLEPPACLSHTACHPHAQAHLLLPPPRPAAPSCWSGRAGPGPLQAASSACA